MCGLPTKALYHYRVGLALRAVGLTLRHVPTPGQPVPPQLLKDALANAHHLASPLPTKLGLLLMFMAFLRQSSVAPQSAAKFDPTRHLTDGDLVLTPQGLQVHVKWTKTLQTSADATSLLLPPTADAALCPLGALREYRDSMPSPPHPRAPLLVHQDGNTLTVPFLRRQWNLLLARIGQENRGYTLHGLRKGAAQYTYNVARADLNDVMTHGTWRSQAVRAYIKPAQAPSNSVYQALKRI